MMLHARYQGPMPRGFRLEDFPYISLCKTCNPGGGVHFWPQRYNLIKQGKPNIKALGLVVSGKKIIFHVFPIKAYVNHVTPDAGPFISPGL